MQAPGPNGVRWFEVDFAEVTKRKAAIIAGNESLRKLLGPAESQSIQPGVQLPGMPAAASDSSQAFKPVQNAQLERGMLSVNKHLLLLAPCTRRYFKGLEKKCCHPLQESEAQHDANCALLEIISCA